MKSACLFLILVAVGLYTTARAETRRSTDSLAVEAASASPNAGTAVTPERDAASGQSSGSRAAAQDHNSSRSNKSASASDDLDSDNDGIGDEQGMAIKEQGIPVRKAKAGKTGSAK